MTEATAKRHLRSMVDCFSGGTVLHLFSEVFGQLAREAKRDGKDWACKQALAVEQALWIVGLGVDAAYPGPGD